MKLLVVGLGYVGLANALVFASFGYDVTAYDTDGSKIDSLLKGISPLEEKGLLDGAKKYKVHYVHALGGLGDFDAAMVCVGTPMGKDGSCDLGYVYSAVESLVQNRVGFRYLIIRSTVVPLTAKNIEARFLGLEGKVVSNPEFLRQGRSFEDEINPERVVVGVSTTEASDFMKDFYFPYRKKGIEYIETSNSSAELGKYASNAFSALKIAYINEISAICEQTGADVRDISRIMGSDSRIGMDFLEAGIGYGGSCFSKDVPALCRLADDLGFDDPLISNLDKSNALSRKRFVHKSAAAIRQTGVRRLGILGLSFKKATPDVRSSLAVPYVREISELLPDLEFLCYDPLKQAREEFGLLFPRMPTCGDLEYVLETADGIAILNNDDSYKTITDTLCIQKKILLVLDGRNLLEKKDFTNTFYVGVGN